MQQNPRKRRQVLSTPIKSPAKSAKIKGVAVETNRNRQDPFPSHLHPTPEECLAVRDDLLAVHGFPQEFAEYRKLRQTNPSNVPISGDGNPELERVIGANTEDGGVSSSPIERESVLDGLVSTVLSQNTTDANSKRAFASLKSAFPKWEDVLTAESKQIENTIRCGGLAASKASCIRNILTYLLEKKGKLCMEYLRDLPIEEVKAELSCFKGIGPKTVACVLMFQLQKDDFPVDTHVLQIGKAVGWIPEVADRNKAYLHLNQRIPDELKFDLNCLLYTHGKGCRKCITIKQHVEESPAATCALSKYSRNLKAS